MLSASIAEYCEYSGNKIALVAKPKLSDLLSGRLYRPLAENTLSPVFHQNPYLHDVSNERSTFTIPLSNSVDTLFEKTINRLSLRDAFDNYLQKKCFRHAKSTGVRYLYKDDIRFSYAESVDDTKMIWRDSPNAVAATLSGFLDPERPPIKHPQIKPAFYGLETERSYVRNLLAKHNLNNNDFIVLEPSTNAEWFSNLRAWMPARWQLLVNQLKESYPGLSIVRIGVPDTLVLDGVIDIRGTTTFRQAALLMQSCRLFIGTEGGLMHAARAVEAKAVILWGGLTDPSFAGYPDSHMILHSPVACAPCGLLGNCPHDVKCMKNISTENTYKAVTDALGSYRPGIIEVSKN